MGLNLSLNFFLCYSGKKTTYKNNLLIKTQIIVWMSNYMRQNRDEISVSLTGALAPNVCLILQSFLSLLQSILSIGGRRLKRCLLKFLFYYFDAQRHNTSEDWKRQKLLVVKNSHLHILEHNVLMAFTVYSPKVYRSGKKNSATRLVRNKYFLSKRDFSILLRNLIQIFC